MRVIAQCAAVGFLAAGIIAPGWPAAAQAPAKDAASVLAAARKALGGESKLSAVKSFTATGRTRQVRGENLVPIEFEIFVELPDKYLRKDEIPAQESGPTASGFNGDELLQDPPPAAPPAVAPGRAAGPGAPPGMPNPADAMRRTRVNGLKQDFARLALGMFAGAYPSYPLTFTYVGQAEAPQGKADVLDAKGPDNLTLRFFIHSDTHLPIMVTWTPPAPAGRGTRPGGMPPGAPGATAQPGGRGGPPAGGAQPPNVAMPPGGAQQPPAGIQPPPATTPPAGTMQPAGPPSAAPPSAAPPSGAAPPPGATAPPPGATAQPAGATAQPAGRGMPGAGPAAPGAPGAPGAAPPPRPEMRLYFADYRDVDGMQFPFRLRRATGTETTEETTFDRYRINAKIDPRRFAVRK